MRPSAALPRRCPATSRGTSRAEAAHPMAARLADQVWGIFLVVVLHAHNYFRPYSGGETSFLLTRELLLKRGNEVIDFSTSHPDNLPSAQSAYFAPGRVLQGPRRADRRIKDGLNAIYSIPARRALARLLDEYKPDVAHLHSVHHYLSMSILDELARRQIPIVYTLHDYKIACPAYTLFTEGEICRRCVDGSVVHAVRHRCVQNSLSASAVAAIEAFVVRLRRTYHHVDRFIAPSKFVAGIAQSAGISGDRIAYVPYFLPPREIAAERTNAVSDPVVLFAGRLHETKGVRELLGAFELVPAPVRLHVAGFGPLEGAVRDAATHNSRITYLGPLKRDDLLTCMDRSRALVLPSIWEDNSPFVILEAQARATAVIASDRGGVPELVRDGVDGYVVDPQDSRQLADRLLALGADNDAAARFGAAGRRALLERHTEDAHYPQLLDAYSRARELRDARPSRSSAPA